MVLHNRGLRVVGKGGEEGRPLHIELFCLSRWQVFGDERSHWAFPKLSQLGPAQLSACG